VVHPFDADGIRYAPCSPTEADEVASVIGRVFAEGDPLALAVGLSAGDIGVFVRATMRVPEVPGLTIVARDLGSGVIAGAVLAEDALSPPLGPSVQVSPRFLPLAVLFDELAAGLPTWHPKSPGKVIHVSMLAVDASFSGRGIAQRLVEACLENAAAHGYRRAVTESSGLVSQHIFRKLGFEMVAERSYAEFRHEGQATFASIAAQGGILAMARPIAEPGRKVPGSSDGET
jgi:ribosomal protein S18 acetylase RimI-like enzyme